MLFSLASKKKKNRRNIKVNRYATHLNIQSLGEWHHTEKKLYQNCMKKKKSMPFTRMLYIHLP